MKIQVGVFFGGRSVEHEVSIISAMQACAALDREKYTPVPVYITKRGLFYTGPAYGDIAAYRDIPALLAAGARVTLSPDGEGRAVLSRWPAPRLGSHKVAVLDAALPVAHGTNAEDGTLQGYLEMLGLPYAGPDVLASAVCMDKAISKSLLAAAGVPVLPGCAWTDAAWGARPDALMDELALRFGFPLVVKPINLGSSVGVTKVFGRDALRDAADLAFRFAPKVLIEPAVVRLREINCAVLGDAGEARASACEEPRGAGEILSYGDKYLSGGEGDKGMSAAPRQVPADLAPALRDHIRALAVHTFQTLGCQGVARVDFLLDCDKNQVYVNEINTIPGSLSFYLWESVGLSFGALLDEMLSLAFKRHRQRAALSFTYESNILSGAGLGAKGGAKR
ncbi:MAG: D-alanine--D-alanine ligase [Oscillospiraceae bacterium]|nr:D-alanine--D-alanine ligase [Oscillospiraceae bacterium]